MSKFLLQPSKIRRDRIVPIKGEEPVEMTLSELRDAVVPIPPADSKRNWRRHAMHVRQAAKLRLVQPGSYIGVMKSRKTGMKTTFFLMNQDRSNKIGWRLKQDASFPSRIFVLYHVISVDWGEVSEGPQEWVG